jgi:Helix-turn-helix domain
MNTPPYKVRDSTRTDWFSIDNLILDVYGKYFGAIGIAVYSTLCRRADAEQKCFPSQVNIAEMLSVSEKTVRKYLEQLEEARIIFVAKDYRNKQGKWLHNVYWLLDRSEWLLPSVAISDGSGRKIETEPSELNDQTQGNVLPTNNTHSNNTHINNTHNAKQSFASVYGMVDAGKFVAFYKPTLSNTEPHKIDLIEGHPETESILKSMHISRIWSAIERGDVDISDDQLDDIEKTIIASNPKEYALV